MIVNAQSSFSDWRKLASLNKDDCSRMFTVTPRTVENWESGKTTPPKAVFLYLAIYCGRLDFLGKAWTGFWLDTDCIVTPEGEPISAGEIRGAPWAYQALGIKRSFSRKIKEENNIDIKNKSNLINIRNKKNN